MARRRLVRALRAGAETTSPFSAADPSPLAAPSRPRGRAGLPLRAAQRHQRGASTPELRGVIPAPTLRAALTLPLCVALCFCACDDEPTSLCTGDTGAQLYVDYCAGCHGDGAQAQGPEAGVTSPGLAGEGLRAWWGQLTREGSRGRYGPRSEMLGFEPVELSDEQLDAVLSYVLYREPAGERLYGGACARCHGWGDGPGESAPALFGRALLDQWREQIRIRQTPPAAAAMPAFPLCADDREALAQELVNSSTRYAREHRR